MLNTMEHAEAILQAVRTHAGNAEALLFKVEDRVKQICHEIGDKVAATVKAGVLDAEILAEKIKEASAAYVWLPLEAVGEAAESAADAAKDAGEQADEKLKQAEAGAPAQTPAHIPDPAPAAEEHAAAQATAGDGGHDAGNLSPQA